MNCNKAFKMNFWLILAVVLTLAGMGCTPKVEKPPESMDAIQQDPLLVQTLDPVLFARLGDTTPGVAILIAKNGKVVYRKSSGMADIDNQLPITADTRFRIGSITKQFTAAAILLLQEEGKLSVEDKISKYIPDYPLGKLITIHHLLTHTSGIHNFTAKPGFLDKVKESVQFADLLESIKKDPLDFTPGNRFSYSNSGYVMLGAIIEEASGLSYEEFLKTRIFQPIGLKNTGIYHNEAPPEKEALGYDSKFGVSRALDWDMSWAGAAGAIYSTVEDLFIWNQAVFSCRLLKKPILDMAHKKVVLNDGSSIGYGYGWGLGAYRGIRYIHHSGGLDGFRSYLGYLPDQDVTMILLTNSAPTTGGVRILQISKQVTDNYLKEYLAPMKEYVIDATVDPSIFNDYVGQYGYGFFAALLVTVEDQRIYAQLTGQPKFEIFPQSDSHFFWKVTPASITFKRDEFGKVTGGIHRQNANEFFAPKLDITVNEEISSNTFDQYTGTFDYGAWGRVRFFTMDDGLHLQLNDRGKLPVYPRAKDEFFAKLIPATIKFIRDSNGEVIKLEHYSMGEKLVAPKIH